MKKHLLIGIIVALFVFALAGCSGTTNVDSSTNTITETSDVEASSSYTGTVTLISADSITITTTDSGDVTIPLTADTVFSTQGMSGGQPGGTMPSGEAPEGGAPEGGASEGGAPEGDAPEGGVPENDTQTETLTYEDIEAGNTVTITTDDQGNAETVVVSQQGAPGGMGGQSTGVESYDAATEYTADAEVEGTSFASTGTDENAVHVYEGANVTLSDVAITRESSDSSGGDNSSFYGVGAAALVTDGTLSISGSTIDTDAAGAAGVFAYGDGVAYVSDSTITTNQGTSGGIHVAGGGTLYAWDLNVETNGASSAAIRSDRGSGTMVVDGGSYTSNGTGSPAVYSTADITINNADLTATGSEAICIEGLNTIRLFDCNLTGNMSDDSQNDCTWNVILYQSMSGDSEVGNSIFEMIGGTLTANNGGMFYTTNTESTFVLSNVDIQYAQDNDFFLKCTGNSNQRGWGSTGSNGADCNFTAIAQDMDGDIIWDSISTLDFYMTDGSTLVGAVIDDESNAGDGGDGYCNLYLGSGCTWVVTSDSTLTSLSSSGIILDSDGNAVTIVGTDGTVYVQGASSYTITVGSYSDSADISGASSIDAWTDYSVEKQ